MKTRVVKVLHLSPLAAYLTAALGVTLACWARQRLSHVTGSAPRGGAAGVWGWGLPGVAVAVAAVWAQASWTARAVRFVPGLAVGIVMGGLAASFGVNAADGWSAVVVTLLLGTAPRVPARFQAWVVAAGFVAGALGFAAVAAVSLGDAETSFAAQVSYATQWRYSAALIDLAVAVVLLGGLGACVMDRSTPAFKVITAMLVAQGILICTVPGFWLRSPFTFLVPFLVWSGTGWDALLRLRVAQGGLVVGRVAIVLMMALALWAWVPLRTLGRALLMAWLGC